MSAKRTTRTYKGKVRTDIVRYLRNNAVHNNDFIGCYEMAEDLGIELPDDSDAAERKFEADFDATVTWWCAQVGKITVPSK